ncbi:hypothetical protein ALC56_11877 [Trachymyrmex septentrionalis]|uniref:Uncharacterized protein n=1 Tax=Trachymyrmex septentrionalis TaxID=34720 RepID=A0A195F0C0_9HYME|nr:hypothetical protein ALC56_11877 [Trachymyrmex septentrionalis]
MRIEMISTPSWRQLLVSDSIMQMACKMATPANASGEIPIGA